MTSRKYGKFTTKRRNLIIEWLGIGHYRTTAAGRAGVCSETIAAWLKTGKSELEACERDDAPLTEHAKFYLAVTEAEAEAENMHFGKVSASANPDDAKWILQRRWSRRWGSQPSRVEVTGADGGAIEVNVDARKSLSKLLGAALTRAGVAPVDPESESGTRTEGGSEGDT